MSIFNAGRRSVFSLSASVAALALAGLAQPAWAQDAPPAPTGDTLQAVDETPEPATGEAAIVVTGSRIRRDNFNTPSPVTIVTRDDTVLAGASGTAETLQKASITSGTSQVSSAFLGFLSEGGQGANTVGLRGLGSARTLTLLNGRRLAPAGVGSQLIAADLNVLPTSVVQRIEVLKEGSSAVYGSDAIGGVINVITDTKLNGVVFDAFEDYPLNLGGAGGTQRVSVTAGKTFDRGYILGSFEYRHRGGVTFRQNPDWNCPRAGFIQNGQEVGQIDPATGKLACFAFGPNGSQGSGIASGYGQGAVYIGPPYNFIYAIGRLGYANGDINHPVATNDFLSRPIRADTQLDSTVITPVETFTGYASGAYELDALGDAELYGEVLFTRRKSEQNNATQFSVDTIRQDPNIEIYGGDAYLGGPIGNYGAANGRPAHFRTSPFFPNSFANFGAYGVNRFLPFILPDRLQHAEQRVDFVRANAGLRGNLGMGDWRYDANFQISRTRSMESSRTPTVQTASNVLMTALAPAGTPADFVVTALPGQAQAGKSYTCASNVTAGAYNGGRCVPLNIFDPNILIGGHLSAALYDYLYPLQTTHTAFDQETASLVFDGTLFNLPAGPVRAAVGFEYRHDHIDNRPSAASQAGVLFGGSNEGITAGSDAVKEVFAELNVPLLHDKPFAQTLEFAGSARYTDYKSYGSDFVYRFNGQYAPIQEIRFRGSYGTNFRAPNLYEQFVNNQSGFFPGAFDPCDSFATLSTGSNTYKNCLAQLTPILDNPATPANEALGFFNASSILANTAGGGGNLKAETATSWGLGVVITLPRTIADFSFAVDYFNTEVRDEVGTLGLNILFNCYDADPASFATDPNCKLIGPRNVLGTPYPGTLSSFQNPHLNLSRQKTSGLDFNLRYSLPVFGGRFQIQAQATRMLHQELEIFAGTGLFDYNGTPGYPGFGSGPKWTGSLDLRYSKGPVTVRWGIDYVGSSSAEGLVTPVPYPANGGTGVAGQPYQEDLVVEENFEHSLSIQYKWKDVGQITLGVKNLFDQKPPSFSDSLDPSGQYFRIANYFGGGPYDYLGRSVFLNVTRSF